MSEKDFENVTIDRKVEAEHDLVKHMDRVIKQTKISLIREKQIQQTKELAEEYKNHHKKKWKL